MLRAPVRMISISSPPPVLVPALASVLLAVLGCSALAQVPPLHLTPRIVETTRFDTEFGAALAGVGDVDGDGFDDLLVGAPSWSVGVEKPGRVFLFRGSVDGVETTHSWSRLGVSDGAGMGRAMAAAGDVNHDGFADVLLAEPKYSGNYPFEGRVLLILGSALGLADTIAWSWEGEQSDARIGYGMCSLGDVDGDGFDDVAIGAHLYDANADGSIDGELDMDRGCVWLFHGNPTGLDALPFSTLVGPDAGAQFGKALLAAGDVDGDGHTDLLVGAVASSGDASELRTGTALLYRGPEFDDPPWWQASGHEADGLFGSALGAGNIEDTAGRDLLVGAWGVDGAESQDEGEVRLYNDAASGGVAGEPGAAAEAVWVGSNGEFRASYGFALAVLGDLDGDGFEEFAVGAFRAEDGSVVDEGEVYLYRGGSPSALDPPCWTGRGGSTDAFFGKAVIDAGDLDGDGHDELAIGAPGHSLGALQPGRVYVYRGGAPEASSAPSSSIPGWIRMRSPARVGSRITYRLEEDTPLRLELYDVRGRLLRVLVEESGTVGEHGLIFDGRDAHGGRLPTGSYVLRMRVGDSSRGRKFVFLP